MISNEAIRLSDEVMSILARKGWMGMASELTLRDNLKRRSFLDRASKYAYKKNGD
jgi:hypothetical protein